MRPSGEPPIDSAGLGSEISVVVPAYNEESRLGDSLGAILAHLESSFDRFEVIVVDDGSTDATVEVARRSGHPALRCLVNAANFGKGYSVRRGVLAARYDPVLFSDADLSTPIEEIEPLLARLKKGCDIAIASRRLARDQEVERSPLRRLLGWGFAKVVQLSTLGGFGDTQCGFKMFRRAAARSIFPYQRIDRWGFDVEVLFIARRRRFEIAEVPVRWHQSEGTRLHWLTPLTMLWELFLIRWNDLLGRYRVRPGREESVHIKDASSARRP